MIDFLGIGLVSSRFMGELVSRMCSMPAVV